MYASTASDALDEAWAHAEAIASDLGITKENLLAGLTSRNSLDELQVRLVLCIPFLRT